MQHRFLPYILLHVSLQRSGLEAIARRLGAAAVVEKVHPHRFRRTSATDLLNVGMPIEQVQELLGHKILKQPGYIVLLPESQ